MLRFLPRLLLAALLLAPVAASAQALTPTAVPAETMSLDVADADIHSVASMIKRQANVEIMVRDGDKPFHPVNVHLQDVSLGKVLRVIAFSAGAHIYQNIDGVYVFTTEDAVPSVVQAPPAKAQAPIDHADLRYYKIVLQHAKPEYVLTLMHWMPDGKTGDHPQLPDGVARISALRSNNALLISATDTGYAQVKTIVKILDVARQQVELKVLFAAVPVSQKLLVDLADPNLALLQLHHAKAIFYQATQIALNNDTAGVSATQMKLPRLTPEPSPWSLPFFSHPANYYSIDSVSEVEITPRINSDNSVTMNLGPCDPAEGNFPKRVDPLRQTLTTLRTTPSGVAIIYEMTNLSKLNDYRVFLFVTPTSLASADSTIRATSPR